LWTNFYPFGVTNIISPKPIILAADKFAFILGFIEYLAFAPKVGMTHCRKNVLAACPFDKNTDGNALLNVKDIFVFGTVRTAFFFLAVAVQVKNVNVVKGLQ